MNNGHTRPKTTAHELWTESITKEITSIIRRPDIREKTIKAVNNHNTTRLRVTTDEMIVLLDESKKEMDAIVEEQKKTPGFRWMKRRKLAMEYEVALTRNKAYQRAVLVLVNTKPPLSTAPMMKVNKD